ncbi:MAG: PEP-CTERM sorting domain-containing protein, partial [Lacipirellulaceae bacterium]
FGIPHSGSTGNFQANALGEDSAAVAYEQGGRVQWLGVPNFPFDRNITRQLNPTPSSSEWWMSIMVNRLNWGNDPANDTYVVGGFTDAGGNGLQVGYDNSAGQDANPDLVLRSNGINTVIAADTASSDNQYVLVKLEIDPVGNDTISVWADPSSVDPLGTADVIITDQDLTSSLAPFTQSKYESPGQSGAAFFDEIRLSTDFDSIIQIPEPASLALLGVAFGLVGVSRKRRVS